MSLCLHHPFKWSYIRLNNSSIMNYIEMEKLEKSDNKNKCEYFLH